MLLLGVLSYFQMIFIPGYLLINIFKIKTQGFIQTAVYSFAFSLITNYFLVFTLTTLRIYKPLAIYCLLVPELIYLLFITGHKTVNLKNIVEHFDDRFAKLIKLNPFKVGIFILSTFCFFFYVKLLIDGVHNVFVVEDAVISWNRWAIDWFNNHFPILTRWYPQLIPANWSLSYLMMQEPSFQLFAKSIMPLFSICIILLFFDLAFKRQSIKYLVGGAVYSLINYYLFSSFIADGDVDIAVSFFSFLSIYTIINGIEGVGDIDLAEMFTSIFFACGAALTKQAGIYTLLFILFFNIYYVLKFTRFSLSNLLKIISMFLLIIFLVAGSWYVTKWFEISQGMDTNNISAIVTGAHDGRGPLERVAFAFQSLYLHYPLLLTYHQFLVSFSFVILCLGASLTERRTRLIFLGIILPFTISWAFLFGYDSRNLALVIPFISYSVGFGVVSIAKKASTFRLVKVRLIYPIMVCFLILLLANQVFSRGYLVEKENLFLKQQLGVPELNFKLSDYKKEHGVKGKILTDYYYLSMMPEFSNFKEGVAYPFVNPNRQISLYGSTHIKSQFLDENFQYLLVSDQILPSVSEKLNLGMAKGKYKLIFKCQGYSFMQVMR